DLPYPIAPQKWHFRQSIEYSITANRAVLDVSSRHREQFLFNAYQIGKNAIERSGRDNWTFTPREIAEAQTMFNKQRRPQQNKESTREQSAERQSGDTPNRSRFGGTQPIKYYEMLRSPEKRDPRGYVIPSDQPDFLTATKFVNALIKTGVTIHRATGEFSIG